MSDVDLREIVIAKLRQRIEIYKPANIPVAADDLTMILALAEDDTAVRDAALEEAAKVAFEWTSSEAGRPAAMAIGKRILALKGAKP